MKVEVELIENKQVDHEKWNKLLELSTQKSVFVEPWYLDTVTNQNWQALVAKSAGDYMGAMPLFNTKSMGFTRSRQPILSKYWGPITRHGDNVYKHLQESKEVTQAMLLACDNLLTETDYMLSPFASYPQQCVWNGFSLKPMFTYYLKLGN